MDHRGQQDDAVNMTRALEALSPYLNDPRQTVIRMEAFVVAAAALLFLQLILGPYRRRSGHWFVQGTLWLAYTASFPLITYTLGQMVASPIKNAMYPRWALILVLAAGCTNSITAYSLDDNKQWKRYLFELMQYTAYICVIGRLLAPVHQYSFSKLVNRPEDRGPTGISFMFLVYPVMFTNFVRAISGWMVTNSLPSNLVVNYMDWLVHERATTKESSDPITMKGYDYLVYWRSRPTYNWGTDGDGIISIDKIWDKEFDDSLLINEGSSRLNDVCLSFALSHLLKRRFFGLECAEAGLPKTHNFIIEGLLSKEDEVNNYSRAFHIIEVELGFLYDFFFTKYASLFHMEVSYLVMALLKLTAICTGAVFLSRDSSTIQTLDPVIEVGTRSVDVTITVMIMGLVFLVEALQVILYLISDWATVSLACGYTTRRGTRKLVPSIIWFVRRFNLSRYWKGCVLDRLNLFGYWKNKMGLSSVFESCLHVNPYAQMRQMDFSLIDDLLFKSLWNASMNICWLIYSMMFGNTTFKMVPDLVKREIVSCLQKSSFGAPLTNGEAALEHNGVNVKLPFAAKTLRETNQTKIMVIWHVATEYCNIEHSSEMEGYYQSSAQEKEKALKLRDNYKQVATTLSRYCAYLMSNVPYLLPGNSTETLSIFEAAVYEASKVLGKGKPSRDVMQKAINDSESSTNEGTSVPDFRASTMAPPIFFHRADIASWGR
ncbi:unnamed protein product [Alopecurus aequalis]